MRIDAQRSVFEQGPRWRAFLLRRQRVHARLVANDHLHRRHARMREVMRNDRLPAGA